MVQSTLLGLLKSWSRAREADNLDAYVHTAVVRVFLSERRKLRREAEVQSLVRNTPTTNRIASHDASTDLRLTILQALRQLPPKPRAMGSLVTAKPPAINWPTGTRRSRTPRRCRGSIRPGSRSGASPPAAGMC